jgi:hypothetical protein
MRKNRMRDLKPAYIPIPPVTTHLLVDVGHSHREETEVVKAFKNNYKYMIL